MTLQELKTPLVSIALCTYNGELYLKEQIDSLIAQSYQNLEIIIFDDCSTDNTVSIIENYQKEYPHIYLFINTENLGFNKNFQQALDKCKGDFIAIADQDDIWELNKVSVMIKNIGNSYLLYHNSKYINNNGTLNGLSIRSHHNFVAGNCAINLLYYNCVAGHTCLINKELLKITPPFPKDFYYDWWFAYTAASIGSINFLNQSLVKHRKHNTSSTSKDIRDPKSLRMIQFKSFLEHPKTTEQVRQILEKLISYYEEARSKKFSLKLFLFLLKNFYQFFYIRKKSTFSKLKFIIRESSR
jgi:glycosyltransferase involved in cell wall biosynthesis